MSRRRSLSPRGLGVFLLIFGAIWLFAGIMATKQFQSNEEKKKVCTKDAVAYITSVDAQRETYRSNGKTKHRTVYYATYEYKVNGQAYHGNTKYQREVSKGQTLSLYYNPNNPSEYITSSEINGQGSLRFMGLIIKIVGGVVGVIGLFKLITGR